MGEGFSEYLKRLPGLVSHGVVLQNPWAPREQQVWAYEVRWLRGQLPPSLPSSIDGLSVRIVVVDEYPRPQAAISGERGGAASIVKTIGLFALFAIPAGILLSKVKESKQERTEKAAFRRLGLDWERRVRQ